MTNPLEATRPGPTRIRTSDAEREQYAEIIRGAMAEGRLDLAEGEERLATAYAVKYRDEFAPLIADLPDATPRPIVDPAVRLATRRGLRRHASFVLAAALILTGLWVLSHAVFFWPIIPLTFLVMGLVRHARWGNYHPRYSYAHHVAPWNAPGHR